MGPNPVRLVAFIRREERERSLFLLAGCLPLGKAMWGSNGRWLSTIQEESPYQTPTILEPWSWTANLQNLEKINFCCLSSQSMVFCYRRLSWLIQWLFPFCGLGSKLLISDKTGIWTWCVWLQVKALSRLPSEFWLWK